MKRQIKRLLIALGVIGGIVTLTAGPASAGLMNPDGCCGTVAAWSAEVARGAPAPAQGRIAT
jgi:hypothetical protein